MRSETVPADVATLAWAAPGQALEIRRVLDDPRQLDARLRPGGIVHCHDITAAGPVFSTRGTDEFRVPWSRAAHVQVERTEFHPCIPHWRRTGAPSPLHRSLYRGGAVLSARGARAVRAGSGRP